MKKRSSKKQKIGKHQTSKPREEEKGIDDFALKKVNSRIDRVDCR
jgi:hypothetical protein